ncbi:MAG: hypothetical protein JW910_15305, partial [Anaerolineae bacterium]|nr:hypothetical protein [Anaerolineae bacterium]
MKMQRHSTTGIIFWRALRDFGWGILGWGALQAFLGWMTAITFASAADLIRLINEVFQSPLYHLIFGDIPALDLAQFASPEGYVGMVFFSSAP